MPNEEYDLPSKEARTLARMLVHRWTMQGKISWRFQYHDELVIAWSLDAFVEGKENNFREPEKREEVSEINKGFNLSIRGTLNETTLPTELNSPTGKFQIAWGNFVREAMAAGVKIDAANFDGQGLSQITLPVAEVAGAHAGV